MSEHTPGPWEATADPYLTANHEEVMREILPGYKAEFPVYVVRHRGLYVAETGCHERSEANARLIAAAPELLEAAKATVENCSCYHGEIYGLIPEDGPIEPCPICGPARAAIARATGGDDERAES